MTRFSQCLFAACFTTLSLLAGCGSRARVGPGTHEDAGTAASRDADPGADDGGFSVADAGLAQGDAQRPLTDAGSPQSDDAGDLPRDAGLALPDAGEPLPDAGVPATDAGPAGFPEVPPPAGCFGGATVRSLDPHSVAYDPSGVLWIAVGGDAVRLFRIEGDAISMEVVDPHGDVPSLAIDSSGQPVVAYFDHYARGTTLHANVETLKVARRVAGRMVPEIVRAELPLHASREIRVPAIAAAPDGALYVAFARSVGPPSWADDAMLLTARAGGSWSEEVVVRPMYGISDLEVAVDGAGLPMVAVSTNEALKLYTRATPTTFATPVAIAPATIGRDLLWTMFVTPAGRAGFVLYDSAVLDRFSIRRLTGVGTDVVECGMPLRNVWPRLSVAVADGGVPVFSSYGYDATRRWRAAAYTLSGASCVETFVTSEPAAVHDNRLVRSTAQGADTLLDRPRLAIAARGDERAELELTAIGGELRLHRSRDGGRSYSTTTLMQTHYDGLDNALTRDAAGRLVGASADYGSDTLSLWRQGGESGWTRETVERPEGRALLYAQPSSLDVGVHASGETLVAYRETDDGAAYSAGASVMVSRRTPAGFFRDVAVPFEGGRPLRMRFDPGGRPVLVTGSGAIRNTGGTWSVAWPSAVFVVDQRLGDLAFDELGTPLALSAWRFQRWNEATSSWTTTDIDTLPSEQLARVDARVGADGTLHVVYTHPGPPSPTWGFEDNRLVYRRLSGGTWSAPEVIALLSTPGRYDKGADFDFELEGGEPVVVFHSFREQGLVFARRAAGTWRTRVVSTDGDTGYSPSIAVDASRTVHVLYHHAGVGDLCYARVSAVDGTTVP